MWNLQSMLFYLLTLFLLLVNCDYRDFGNQNFSENLIEGDMILNEEQNRWFTKEKSPHRRIKRNAGTDAKYLWPNGIVYYEIDEDFAPEFRIQIEKAKSFITDNTCVRFKPKGERTIGYVRFQPGNGCFSEIGFQNKTQYIILNPVEVDKGCFKLGGIMHEVLHILGFFHQHSVWNRDDFITIKYENIKEGQNTNFEKIKEEELTDLGVGYDYLSVIHYPKGAFSKNGEPTIVPKDPNAEIGFRETLSPKDILKINKLYNCPITKLKPVLPITILK